MNRIARARDLLAAASELPQNKIDRAISFKDYYADFASLCKKHEFDTQTLSNGTIVATKKGAGKSRKRLVIVSGVHGDERSGPVSILEWMRTAEAKKLTPDNVDLMVLPLINDAGWKSNDRRWNGVDLNRSFFVHPTPKDHVPDFQMELMDIINQYKPTRYMDLHTDDRRAYYYAYIHKHDPKNVISRRLVKHFQIKKWVWDETDKKRWHTSEHFARNIGCKSTTTVEVPNWWPLKYTHSFLCDVLKWFVKA